MAVAIAAAGCDEPSSPPPSALVTGAQGSAPTASSSSEPAPPVEPPPRPPTPMFEPKAASRALAMLRDHIGKPIQALDVAVFPSHIRVQLQPPAEPGAVVTYEVRGGKVGGPVPVQVSGGGGVSSSLFTIEADHLEHIDEMVRVTERELTATSGREGKADGGAGPLVRGARADYVSLARDLPFSRRLLFRVFVSGAETSGYADFDPKGKLLRAAEGSPR